MWFAPDGFEQREPPPLERAEQAREPEEKKTAAEKIQDTFSEGKAFLDQRCGAANLGEWELGTGFSFNLNPMFTFDHGLWKVRWKRSEDWADPAARTPPGGKGARETQEILNRLAELNQRSGGEGYPDTIVRGLDGRLWRREQIVRLEYHEVPIAVNDRIDALNVIRCDKHGVAWVWFPKGHYRCVEVDPDDPRKEYWGREARTDGIGAYGIVGQTQWFRLKEGQKAAVIGVWVDPGPFPVDALNKAERERRVCFYIKLVRVSTRRGQQK